MRLPACVSCGLPVLELRGQHTFLDSFYQTAGGPPPATAGSWHARCLNDAAAGPAWHRAQVQSYVDVRRYINLAETAGYTVVQQPTGAREIIAISRSGVALPLGFRRAAGARVEGGMAYPLTRADFGFEWDAPVVVEIQHALQRGGTHPVLAVAERLGIVDRLTSAAVLAPSRFRFDAELVLDWNATFVLAAVDYHVFVPDELVRFVVT